MIRILTGDALAELRKLPSESVHMCCTSPPYFGLRDYGCAGQIGLEPTPDEYIAALVAVFREVRRVLRKDGTLWLNIGDSYAADPTGKTSGDPMKTSGLAGMRTARVARESCARRPARQFPLGVKRKDLIGIPWMLAFALRADGWYLRQDIIWAKPNPMPESVTDRCTKAHEYIFLLSKSERYWYDAAAIAEPSAYPGDNRAERTDTRKLDDPFCQDGGSRSRTGNPTAEKRNRRSVWTIATQPYPDAHFATYPIALVEPMVNAGTSEKGCCAKCGAPWTRQVERRDTGSTQKMADGWDTGEGGHGTIHRSGRQSGEAAVPVTVMVTKGWSPSCQCEVGDPVPCTVLDPFLGAGTTALVADRLGRNAIGIELNPAYAAMARERVTRDAGLFADFAAD